MSRRSLDATPSDTRTPPETTGESVASVQVRRVRGSDGAGGAPTRDHVGIEEPLQLLIGTYPLAVVMRTPGHDIELVHGLLLGERIISGIEDVLEARHSTLASSPERSDNVVRVRLAKDFDPTPARRGFVSAASCGVCGRATIDALLADAPALGAGPLVDAGVIAGFADTLAGRQPGHALCGGLHGAALFDAQGRCLVVREDVGRHNAVDKVVGWALAEARIPLRDAILWVSGRLSFEIVQKAWAAGIPIVAAVSAPSSLAVELGERAGMTLVGFVRGGEMNVYADPSRVRVAGR